MGNISSSTISSYNLNQLILNIDDRRPGKDTILYCDDVTVPIVVRSLYLGFCQTRNDSYYCKENHLFIFWVWKQRFNPLDIKAVPLSSNVWII